jgi:hypothetical protein
MRGTILYSTDSETRNFLSRLVALSQPGETHYAR